MKFSPDLIIELAMKVIRLAKDNPKDIERHCWLIVHEYHHGFIPVEYDIREIDENLYLTVLDHARKNL